MVPNVHGERLFLVQILTCKWEDCCRGISEVCASSFLSTSSRGGDAAACLSDGLSGFWRDGEAARLWALLSAARLGGGTDEEAPAGHILLSDA